ncbi:putative quinol monooxygenase [Synechocystis sp. PCC 7338]|uniref:putative quinol monooxygenase n=1 Tax=Synechocystis sp. PCC 7338 TaxID=2732530 RepID=UPI001BAF1B31|nr:antibiotic biosynthesis monooxygenase [Synechocystis sp. PCC 7338]
MKTRALFRGQAVLLGVLLTLVIPLFFLLSIFLLPLPAWADTDDVANQSIIVAGNIKVRPEKRQEFIALSQTFIEPSRSEPGCISYSFYEDETEDNKFLFFEVWRNRAALDYHFQTPYFHEFVEKSPDLLAKAAEIKVYKIAGFETL